MKKLFTILATMFGIATAQAQEPAESIYQIEAKTLDGETIKLSQYEGKVLLIVNTASKCGFTPQYEGLQTLHETYKDKGLVVLGFPCNQFANQEPGSTEDIAKFCSANYGVTFQMFEKINVNGADTHPLYVYLKDQAPGVLGTEGIKWNFTKFLITKNGQVYNRYSPSTDPAELQGDIELLLGQ